MNRPLTAALTLLLFAAAGGAALAQEQDRRDSQSAPAHPQAPHSAPQGRPPGGPQGGPQGGPPGGHGQGGGAAPQGPRFQGQGPGDQRYSREAAPGVGGAPGPGRGPAPGAGRPPFDHERGPHEVIPPGSGPDRGFDRAGDGHGAGAQIDARNGAPIGRGGPPQRWAAGRYPPVYWAQQRFRAAPYRAPYGYYVRAWAFGDFLPRGWYGQPYWLNDFGDYGLPYPPPGFEWVRVGGDAIMVDQYSGRVVQVVRGIFW